MVYSPVHAASFENFQNLAGLEAFQARLAALPNAVVIDMQRLDLPDEYFKDTSHLLPDGAVKFSRALGERIRAELRERSRPARGRRPLASRDTRARAALTSLPTAVREVFVSPILCRLIKGAFELNGTPRWMLK